MLDITMSKMIFQDLILVKFDKKMQILNKRRFGLEKLINKLPKSLMMISEIKF